MLGERGGSVDQWRLKAMGWKGRVGALGNGAGNTGWFDFGRALASTVVAVRIIGGFWCTV